MDAMLVDTPASVRSRPRRVGTPGGWAPWAWLACGSALLSVSVFRTVIPVAAWLAWVFLLRFARSRPAWLALPAMALAVYPAYLVALRGTFPVAQLLPFALFGLGDLLPIAVDRALADRLRGLPRTLVFPLAATAFGFVAGSGQFGTLGAPGYTQVDNLVLSQVLSVTGLSGVAFLMFWLAAVANEVWERGWDLRAAAAPAGAFAVTLALVAVSGGAQLAFSPPAADTVRVAAIAPNRALSDAYREAGIGPGPRTAAQRAAIRERYMAPIIDDLFARTDQAADAGAAIVAWSEAAAFVFAEDEPSLLDRAGRVAAARGIYLQIGLVSVLPREELPHVDIRAVLFDPRGAVVWDYPKATVPLDDGNVPGPGVVPVADTPHGRLATIICFDADFPPLVRQAGRGDVDILFVPSSDWEAIADIHARMVVPRAIENGVAVVRPARQGISLAVDSRGRTLARADYFTQDAVTMLVDVPTRGRDTVYPRIGDVSAWMSVAGLLALAGVATVRGRRAGRERRHARTADAED